MDKQARFDELWGRYVDKLNRLDELKKLGRYGYQLRMPNLSIRRAAEALKTEFPDEVKGIIR